MPAPVSLQEFRDFLNIPAANTADDEEMWGKVLSATTLVEERVGALEPRSVTSQAFPAGGCEVSLPVTPVLSVQSVTDNAASAAVTMGADSLDTVGGILLLPYRTAASGGSHGSVTVVYTAGRVPVPDALREAVLIVAAQLWQSQRGPSSRLGYSAGSDMATWPTGFAWPTRAVELVAAYERVGIS